jgi:Tfp pilus assembly protein PilP
VRRDLRDRLALLIAVLALLALAGCGGDEKDDVISEGDQICREANGKLEDLEEPDELSGLPDYARQARPIFDDAVEDLKALEPPDDGRESFDEFIERSEELAAALEELEVAGSDTTDAELQAMSDRIGEITDEANAAAADYGFEDCSE